MYRSRLPAHYEPKEHILDAFSAELFDTEFKDISSKVKTCRDPLNCDHTLLNTLAKDIGTDFWTDDICEVYKRDLILNTIKIKRIKGTEGAVLLALSSLNLHTEEYPAKIIEYWDKDSYIYRPKYDGATFTHDGSTAYNGGESMLDFEPSAWNEFIIWLSKPIDRIQELYIDEFVLRFKAARSKLIGVMYDLTLPFDGASFMYDGKTKYI